AEQLQSAVAETLKYSVKPEDMANDPEWFLELTRVELWRDCLRVNYEPNIDIRAVKTKTGEVVANVAEQLQSAVAETLKYSVKPEDMANDPEWFLELTR
ncbi:protein rep, partial [Escherichia coli]|uniref:protein rep n=1 Tax=Escherichia coli TaxID=562 RepID=UPI00201E7072